MHNFPTHNANIMLLLLLFAVILHRGMCSLGVQCNKNDQHALLNFKHTVIDSSAMLSTWSVEQDCCQWTGVQCHNTTGRVTKLNLPCSHKESSAYAFEEDKSNCLEEDKSHCLTGELSLSLLQLEFLDHLDLSNNDFKTLKYDSVDPTHCHHNLSVAECPHSFENSSKLLYLDLSYNSNLHIDNLQWLSRLSSLKYINFNGIDLHKETDWLQLVKMLPSLLELHLSGCRLNNINPSLQYANFTSLEVLDLSNNAFGSQFLPYWLFNLSSNISDIDLSNNLFRGQLPNTLLNLRNLKSLKLSENKLSGPIPDWLGQLEQLQNLSVSSNLFSGPIPPTLGNLSSLTSLDIRSNLLNGSLPESFGELSNLEALYIEDNSLTGVAPNKFFVKLSNLKMLAMGSPGLIFDFHPLWVPNFQLEFLDLKYVDSKLPAWLYTQKSLQGLKIESSRISFESHDRFWNFVAQLESFRLADNFIDGDMSNVLLNSTVTIIRSNNLKGGGLPQLSPYVAIFDISNNSMSGPISSFLCQKMNGRSELLYLDMSNNHLFGGLTNCWTNWKSLLHVKLNNNHLTGKIPPSMGLLSNLVELDLSKNNLFGEIPRSLKNCSNLEILNVKENQFSGNIPNWIAHNAKVLLFTSNRFHGQIPPQLCQLSSLIILDFADNKVSGSIPPCLYNITAMVFNNSVNETMDLSPWATTFMLHIKGQELNYIQSLKLLRVIDLSSNNLSGLIPPTIFSLTGLHHLNLSHNQFMGNIPKDIGNLKQLESLDLSSNQLSGEIPQSISELSFLGSLNLSFNDFSGKIPFGTQLQGFDALSYVGNPGLCGDPLRKSCTHEEDVEPKGESEDDNNEDEFLFAFTIGMGVGFAIGFWGVCSAIFFNKTCKYSYFRFLNRIADKVSLMVLFKINCFR